MLITFCGAHTQSWSPFATPSMLIFLNWGGGGGGRWYIGPLITLLPLILSSGLLALPFQLLSLLVRRRRQAAGRAASVLCCVAAAH